MSEPVRILFVCSGNICRSPTAHGVLEALIRREGLSAQVLVDSCGTGDWHAGEPPDPRSQLHARRRGYDLSRLRAKQVTRAALLQSRHVLVMDNGHLREIRRLAEPALHERVRLFLDFAPNQPIREVPDPYYGGEAGFEEVLDLVEAASRGLIEHLRLKLP